MNSVSSFYIDVFEENPDLETHLIIIEKSINQAVLKKFNKYNLNLQRAFDISLVQINKNYDWIEILAETHVEAFGCNGAKGLLLIKRKFNQSKWSGIMQNIDQIVSAVCDLIQQLIGEENHPKEFPNKVYK